jgi:hypothetical protein
MPRRKRSSDSIAHAETRASGLASIDASLDLGNELTLATYRQHITDAKTALDSYNSKLSEVDTLLNTVESRESDLDELSARMLAAVGVKYGKDSDEYEQAGGTRSSERKSPHRSAAPVTANVKS